MNKKLLSLMLMLVLVATVFVGCAKETPAPTPEAPNVETPETPETPAPTTGELKDGTYIVKKEVSDKANFSMGKLEVKDGVASLDFNQYLATSGEAKNNDNYPYAVGIEVIADLNAQFNDKKDLSAVNFDAVAGATHTKDDFKVVVEELLAKAAKGETTTSTLKDGVYEATATEESHGWLPTVKVTVTFGQVVGVDYTEVATADGEGYKKGDAKSTDNYSFAVPFEVIPQVQKAIIDNNGVEGLNVDAISGATNTRTSMVTLVTEALSQAK